MKEDDAHARPRALTCGPIPPLTGLDEDSADGGKEWTQLNHGGWTVLEPRLTRSYKRETKAKLRQMRGQH